MRRDHYFNAVAAQTYGVDGAVMLHHLVYWVVYNHSNGINEVDGKVWTYNSARAFRRFFPWWSGDQIRRVLRNLESDGAISTGTFNKLGMDRTKWYTVTDAVADIYDLDMPQFGERQNGSGDSASPISAIAKMHSVKRQDQYQVKNQGEEPKKNHVMLPWADDVFGQLWSEWKDDRRERGIKNYTSRGEQAALHKLQKDSGGDVATAITMIQNSIANGYQGIFPVSNRGSKRTPEINPDTIRNWAAGGR